MIEKMKNKVLMCILVILIILFVLLILFSMRKSINKKDSFSDISKLLETEVANDESYQKCINENDQLSYATNGKYNNCAKMLSDLSKAGIDASSDIGFGKLTEICPYSSLASSPVECLKPRLDSQTKILDETTRILNKNPQNFQMQKMSDDMELQSYSNQLDKLYKTDNIKSAASYIKKNKTISTDKAYNNVLIKYTTPTTQPPK